MAIRLNFHVYRLPTVKENKTEKATTLTTTKIIHFDWNTQTNKEII